MSPASINSGSTATASTTSTTNWRKRGQRLRAALIEQDDAQQHFCLSDHCPIDRYYQVADKVLDQFLHHPIDTRDELLEAYMVGHRLVQFLSRILPTHGSYFAEAAQRDRSQEQLVQVLQYLDQMAVLIDKQEHEDYIRSVLGAAAADETNHSSSTQSVNNTTMTSMTNYGGNSGGGGGAPVGGDPNSSFESSRSKTSSQKQQQQQPKQPAKSSLKQSSHRENTARANERPPKQPMPQNSNPQRKRPMARSVPQPQPQPPPKSFVRSAPLQNAARQTSLVDESDFLLDQTEASNSMSRSDQTATEQGNTINPLNASHDSNVKAIAKNWPPQKNNNNSSSSSTPSASKSKATICSKSSNIRSPVKLQQQPPPQRSPETVRLQFKPMNEFQRKAAESSDHSPSKKPSSQRKAPWQNSSRNDANNAGSNINGVNTKSNSESNISGNTSNNIGTPVKKRDPSSERKTIISVESPKASAAANDRQSERNVAIANSRNHKINAGQDPNTATTTTATWEESYARNIQTVPSRSPTSSVAAKEELDEIPDPEELSLGSSAFEREESVSASQRTSSVAHEEKKDDREEENASSTRSNNAPTWTGFGGNQQQVDESMHELNLSHESSMYSNGTRNSVNQSTSAAVNVSQDQSLGGESARPLLLQNDFAIAAPRDVIENVADSVNSSINNSGAYFLPFNKPSSSDRNSFEKEDVSFDSVDFEQGNQARSTEGAQRRFPPVVTPTESSKRHLRQTVSKGDEQLVRTKAMARQGDSRSRFRKSERVAPAVVSPNEPPEQRSAYRNNLPLVAAYSASAQDWSILDEQSVMSKTSMGSSRQTMQNTEKTVAAATTMDMEDGDFYFSSENMRSSSSGSRDFSTAANSAGANDLLGIVKDPSPGSWQQAWVSSGSGAVVNDRLTRSTASTDRSIRPGVSAGDQEPPDRRRSIPWAGARRDDPMHLEQSLTSSTRKKSSGSLKPSVDHNTTDTTTTATTRSSSTASLFSESHTGAAKSMPPADTSLQNVNKSIAELESRWDDAKFAYYRGSADDDASFSREPRPCQLICRKRNNEKEHSPNEHWDIDDDSSLQLLKPNRRDHFRNCVRFLLD